MTDPAAMRQQTSSLDPPRFGLQLCELNFYIPNRRVVSPHRSSKCSSVSREGSALLPKLRGWFLQSRPVSRGIERERFVDFKRVSKRRQTHDFREPKIVKYVGATHKKPPRRIPVCAFAGDIR